MPMEASDASGLSGNGFGCAGFSSNPETRSCSFTVMMLNQPASLTGTRMQAVAEWEIDYPVLAAKWHAGLRTICSQRIQSGSLTSSQQKTHMVSSLQIFNLASPRVSIWQKHLFVCFITMRLSSSNTWTFCEMKDNENGAAMKGLEGLNIF